MGQIRWLADAGAGGPRREVVGEGVAARGGGGATARRVRWCGGAWEKMVRRRGEGVLPRHGE